MKPAQFQYARPATVEEAVGALADHGDQAKILAGGQSLVPAMNFRLAYPPVLVDIRHIGDLNVISSDDRWLTVGAGVTQRALERSEHLRASPLVGAALPWVGHLQTRNRGTVGGNLAHADPAAELPAVAVALDAEIDVRSATGTRTIAAAEFFKGPFTTDVAAGEMVVAVRFPSTPGTVGMCDEVVRRHGDFAIAGAAMQVAFADGGSSIEEARIAGFGIGGTPQRLVATERLLTGEKLRPELAVIAGESAAGEVDQPWSDIHGSGDYRRGALGALVARMVAGLTDG